MTDDQKNIFKALVDPVFELYGQDASKPTLSLWWNALKRFEFGLVKEAFNRYVQDPKLGRFAPKPADIIGAIELLIPDGRLNADEAWGLYPHDESTSAVITDEMAEAMQSAQPLLDAGDKISARMAFKGAYDRVVLRNKSQGIVPKWFPSLGSDPNGREIALKAAVNLGRIGEGQALELLPTPKESKLMDHLPELRLLTAKQELTDEQKQAHESRMKEIRQMLIGGTNE